MKFDRLYRLRKKYKDALRSGETFERVNHIRVQIITLLAESEARRVISQSSRSDGADRRSEKRESARVGYRDRMVSWDRMTADLRPDPDSYMGV
jgi:hypothetical protein